MYGLYTYGVYGDPRADISASVRHSKESICIGSLRTVNSIEGEGVPKSQKMAASSYQPTSGSSTRHETVSHIFSGNFSSLFVNLFTWKTISNNTI